MKIPIGSICITKDEHSCFLLWLQVAEFHFPSVRTLHKPLFPSHMENELSFNSMCCSHTDPCPVLLQQPLCTPTLPSTTSAPGSSDPAWTHPGTLVTALDKATTSLCQSQHQGEQERAHGKAAKQGQNSTAHGKCKFSRAGCRE